MSKRSGLGRGLDALIPGGERPSSGTVSWLPVDQISPNPYQPRRNMNPEELVELADSIRQHGILQPLVVTFQTGETDRYILIAGHRRLMAAQQAGLVSVPALVREAGEQQRLELALIENIQRTDLNPLELAAAYHQLSDEFALSHEQIADQVGKSRVSVTNTLRLLKLPNDVQHALLDNQISEGHARALLALPTPQAQSAALRTIQINALNVRQTEELVRRMQGERPVPKLKPVPPPEIRDLEERFRRRFGTKVNLTRHGQRGTLVIHFYSDEELDKLIEDILGE
jgi:ParB family chromosome partitioning protein